MNFEKVVFGFFITLALTLNFGFFVGGFDNPVDHNGIELVAALVVSLIATVHVPAGPVTHVAPLGTVPVPVAVACVVAGTLTVITVFGTGLLNASLAVTVAVAALPTTSSAGETDSSDFAADTGPGTKLIVTGDSAGAAAAGPMAIAT